MIRRHRSRCGSDAYGYPYDACHGADLGAHRAQWDVFGKIDLDQVRSRMRRPAILDAADLLDPADAWPHRFTYEGVGIRTVADLQPLAHLLAREGLQRCHAVTFSSPAARASSARTSSIAFWRAGERCVCSTSLVDQVHRGWAPRRLSPKPSSSWRTFAAGVA